MPGRESTKSGMAPTPPSQTRVRVNIDGDILTIRGTAAEVHVQRLAADVNERIARVREVHPNIPRHHAAILVALHLADELHRVTAENEELIELLEEQ